MCFEDVKVNHIYFKITTYDAKIKYLSKLNTSIYMYINIQ